jgi:hypothetical protein
MNENKLKQCIDTYLVQEQDTLDGSYFFFETLPADIEVTRVIDKTLHNNLKTYDDISDLLSISV